MSERDFVIEYVLARARAINSPMDEEGVVEAAYSAWRRINELEFEHKTP